jgi:hypothetical protein
MDCDACDCGDRGGDRDVAREVGTEYNTTDHWSIFATARDRRVDSRANNGRAVCGSIRHSVVIIGNATETALSFNRDDASGSTSCYRATICIRIFEACPFGGGPAQVGSQMMRRLFFALVFIVSIGAPTSAAAADESPLSQSLNGEAKALYEMGRSLFEKGDIASALSKFTHAYELSKDPRLMWNVAACEAGLKHWAKAMTAVDRYLALAGPLLTDKDKEQATRFRSAARPLVAQITLDVKPDPVTIDIDGEPVGQSPFNEPIYVDAGQHRIRFSKAGYRGIVRTSDLQGGGTSSMTITLERLRIVPL